MDDRKQYAKKVVVDVINFMAMAGEGILPSIEEAEKRLDCIPEELHSEIIAALMAAYATKKIAMLSFSEEASQKEQYKDTSQSCIYLFYIVK